MKHNVLLATLLAIGAVTSSGRSLTISPSPNITRNAGQTIPLTFSASGFASGQVAQIWLINAKSWTGDIVEIEVPVVNGVNNHPVTIPWSWEATGPYVVKIVAGSNAATDARVVTIRSAIIWPYAGTTYPSGGQASITWVVGNWDLGETMDFLLHNEDTGEGYALDTFCFDPYSGRFVLDLPDGVIGDHFRIYVDAFYAFSVMSDDSDSQDWFDYVQSTRSAVVRIR